MALAESIEYDKIEIVGTYKAVQVRKKNSIQKDGVEIASTYERYTLDAGILKGGLKDDGVTPADDANDYIETDISGQPTEVQNICNVVWTTDIKNAHKAYLIANKVS